MAYVEDVLAYLSHNYPWPGQLSMARLSYMLYLADWRSALLYDKPVSNVRWHLEGNAPQPSQRDPHGAMTWDELERIFLELIAEGNPENVERQEKAVLDYVIATACERSLVDLIRLVNSTFPVITQPQNQTLNLVGLAQDYRKHYQPLFASS